MERETLIFPFFTHFKDMLENEINHYTVMQISLNLKSSFDW